MIPIERECVELFLEGELLHKGVKFPANAPTNTGFGLRSRKGRIYVMHAESEEAWGKWLLAIKSIGANMVYSDETAAELKRVAEGRPRVAESTPTPPPQGPGAPEPDADTEDYSGFGDESDGDDDEEEGVEVEEEETKSYITRVVGGMTIKTEIKK